MNYKLKNGHQERQIHRKRKHAYRNLQWQKILNGWMELPLINWEEESQAEKTQKLKPRTPNSQREVHKFIKERTKMN